MEINLPLFILERNPFATLNNIAFVISIEEESIAMEWNVKMFILIKQWL